MNRELELVLLIVGFISTAYGIKKNNSVVAAIGCIFIMAVILAESVCFYNDTYYKIMDGVYK